MTIYITSPLSVSRTLIYNERKVAKKEAELLYAGNYLLPASDLSLDEKRFRIEHQNELADRPVGKTLHLAINFHPADSLDRGRLISIALDYMKRIGFERQPYLVYQHFDAGHPHLHVVASRIDAGGRQLEFYCSRSNLGLAAAMEEKYGLIGGGRAKALNRGHEGSAEPRRLVYGVAPTAQGMSEIIAYVLREYKIDSFRSFNAVLRGYDISAQQGLPGSRMYERGGLVYQALDRKGKIRGAAIKASTLEGGPTRRRLEEIFVSNLAALKDELGSIRSRVSLVLKKLGTAWHSFIDGLKSFGLEAVPYASVGGSIQDIIIIDKIQKVAVRTESLGEGLDMASLARSLALPEARMVRPMAARSADIDRAIKILAVNPPMHLSHQKSKEVVMLYKDTVEKGTLNLLKEIMTDKRLEQFLLVGGTALSLRLGHRRSVDLDLFHNKPFDAAELARHMDAKYKPSELVFNANQLSAKINGVKVDFMTHPYPLVRAAHSEQRIRMASLEDIAVMKLHAIINTGQRVKDFIDIHKLLEHMPLRKMLDLVSKKYPDYHPEQARLALQDHREVRFKEQVQTIGGASGWEEIASRMQEAVLKPDKLFPALKQQQTIDQKTNQHVQKRRGPSL